MRKHLYFLVFSSGMTSLALEMAISRLLNNIFGTSNLVWASVIGIILVYLAVGYFLGGYWADKSPNEKTFHHILLWAAFYSALIPVISRPVLRLAADAFDQLQLGILLGSFTAVFILLLIPMILLGTASPFAIRLAIQDPEKTGSVSGKIYAISTLGSFLGTFLPVLVLIPSIGTYRTFMFFSLLLILSVFISMVFRTGFKSILPFIWMPFVIVALWIWGLPGGTKQTANQIYESESAYNYIQVLEDGEYRYLRLNEGQGVHSIYNPTELNYYGPWEQVLAAPYFNQDFTDPKDITSMAIVGLAAGTTARQAAEVYPNISIDGFEIDPKIVEVGYEYFGMDIPQLNVIIQDGRWGLEHSSKKYQIISVDAYRPPYIPAHMTTVEFFTIVRDHLTDDGVMVINVGRAPEDRRLINTLCTTIYQVFPSIHVMDVPESYNSILFATFQPTTTANFYANLDTITTQNTANPLLISTMQITAIQMQPTPVASGRIFTDDVSPIEWLTNTMILNYLLIGDAS